MNPKPLMTCPYAPIQILCPNFVTKSCGECPIKTNIEKKEANEK